MVSRRALTIIISLCSLFTILCLSIYAYNRPSPQIIKVKSDLQKTTDNQHHDDKDNNKGSSCPFGFDKKNGKPCCDDGHSKVTESHHDNEISFSDDKLKTPANIPLTGAQAVRRARIIDTRKASSDSKNIRQAHHHHRFMAKPRSGRAIARKPRRSSSSSSSSTSSSSSSFESSTSSRPRKRSSKKRASSKKPNKRNRSRKSGKRCCRDKKDRSKDNVISKKQLKNIREKMKSQGKKIPKTHDHAGDISKCPYRRQLRNMADK